MAVPPPPAADAFISYAHKNKPLVDTLKYRLKQLGVHAWIDDGMRAGDSLWKEVSAGIHECRVFLVFLSPEYVNSTSCCKEFELAVCWDKRVVPIVVKSFPQGERWPPRCAISVHLAPLMYVSVTTLAPAFELNDVHAKLAAHLRGFLPIAMPAALAGGSAVPHGNTLGTAASTAAADSEVGTSGAAALPAPSVAGGVLLVAQPATGSLSAASALVPRGSASVHGTLQVCQSVASVMETLSQVVSVTQAELQKSHDIDLGNVPDADDLEDALALAARDSLSTHQHLEVCKNVCENAAELLDRMSAQLRGTAGLLDRSLDKSQVLHGGVSKDVHFARNLARSARLMIFAAHRGADGDVLLEHDRTDRLDRLLGAEMLVVTDVTGTYEPANIVVVHDVRLDILATDHTDRHALVFADTGNTYALIDGYSVTFCRKLGQVGVLRVGQRKRARLAGTTAAAVEDLETE